MNRNFQCYLCDINPYDWPSWPCRSYTILLTMAHRENKMLRTESFTYPKSKEWIPIWISVWFLDPLSAFGKKVLWFWNGIQNSQNIYSYIHSLKKYDYYVSISSRSFLSCYLIVLLQLFQHRKDSRKKSWWSHLLDTYPISTKTIYSHCLSYIYILYMNLFLVELITIILLTSPHHVYHIFFYILVVDRWLSMLHTPYRAPPAAHARCRGIPPPCDQLPKPPCCRSRDW